MPRGTANPPLFMEEGDSMGEGDGVGLDLASKLRFLSGNCPDPKCQARLTYMSSYQSIECTGCGQMHAQSALLNVREEKGGDVYKKAMFALKSLITQVKPEPGTDNIKVYGLSNYMCKLVSHLLSHYGMDRATGKAKLLTDMGLPEVFNCGLLCERAFLIDQEHLNTAGYGKDRSGAGHYLSDTLTVARQSNDDEDRLVPIHADGDGHCLVHAISRALVGRELFWHPLRLNLMQHLRDNLDRYKDLFKNFVDADEWDTIIEECSPTFVPKDGEPVGLRNIHIFGLANVLKRPIILLDSLSGISSSGDYSAVFLPALLTPEECMNKDKVLNCPLCIAWSSQGRNHFIPLVGIKDKPCPRLPRYMLQKTWGVHQSLLDQYMAFDDQGCCRVGGTSTLKESYIQRLVSAMEAVFYDKYHVKPALVADVHQYIFRTKGLVGVTPEMERDKTLDLVTSRALVRCLRCRSLRALPELPLAWFYKGGQLYNMALKDVGQLRTDKLYTFTETLMYSAIACRYSADQDCLVRDLSDLQCEFCQSLERFRYVRGDGIIEYHEADVTLEPSGPNTRCKCGYKHFYGGKFYDNRPRDIPVPLDWAGKKTLEMVQWFENESDPELNSNVYQIASDLVDKHYPGEFGIERLQQNIVQAILLMTARQDIQPQPCQEGPISSQDKTWDAHQASKIILSGFQSKGIHKEDLQKSETERQVRKNIQSHAPQQQARKTHAEAARNTPAKAQGVKSKAAASSTPTTTAKVPSFKSDTPSATGTVSQTTPPAAGDAAAVADTPPTPGDGAAGKEKKIRLVVTGGQAVTLTLKEEVSYSGLQSLVSEAVNIPPQHQKLRLGFPPKVLTPPAPGHEDDPVIISHGDKITVDNAALMPAPTSAPPSRRSMRGHTDAHMPSEDALLNALSSRHSGGDILNNSVSALLIVAQTMGIDPWELIQSQPHHFSQGGLYYLQAERDLGLVHDKHFTFQHFPGKIFVYNSLLDRLELCVEGVGHFEVEANVESKARAARSRGQTTGHHTSGSHHASHTVGGVGKIHHEDSGRTSFGSSGAITKPQNQHHHQHQHQQTAAFEGLGHILRDLHHHQQQPHQQRPRPDDRMPEEDVPLTESIQGAARRLHDLCDPQHNSHSTIAEEPEKMEVAESSNKEEEQGVYLLPKYTRKGPGFSVLDPPPSSRAPPVQAPDAAQVSDVFRKLQKELDRMQGQGDSDEDIEDNDDDNDDNDEDDDEDEAVVVSPSSVNVTTIDEEDGGDDVDTTSSATTTTTTTTTDTTNTASQAEVAAEQDMETT